MPDRESVITHLMIIRTWASFARERDLQFFTEKHLEDMVAWADEAVALLKEQEAVVLCKDCKYGEPGACGDGVDCDGVWHNDDWFCADGERKEDGKC